MQSQISNKPLHQGMQHNPIVFMLWKSDSDKQKYWPHATEHTWKEHKVIITSQIHWETTCLEEM